MSEPTKTERPMVPVLPSWCDWHLYTLKQRIMFNMIICAAINVIIFIAGVAILLSFDYTIGDMSIIIELLLLTIGRIFLALYFIYATKAGYPWVLKRWIFCDIIATAIFAISLIALVCSMPDNKVVLIVGIKTILVSVWVCYRSSMLYMKVKDPVFLLQENA